MSAGSYVIWNDLCQSIDSGEEDEGWPSYEAALSACSEGSDMPAFHGPQGLVFGAAACAKAEAALLRADAQDASASARRAAVVAAIAAQASEAVVAKPDRAVTLAKMLAGCQSSLAIELAKGRRADKAEVARLAANISKLQEVTA